MICTLRSPFVMFTVTGLALFASGMTASAQTVEEKIAALQKTVDETAAAKTTGEPTVTAARAKAKELAEAGNLHIMDALSEVGLSDPQMMKALRRRELQIPS